MIKYNCSICGTNFADKKSAERCEQRKRITKRTILNVGDLVKIKNGDGAGEYAKITKKTIFDISWGHYMWERYWHTEGLIVSFDNGCGRILTFDDYYEDLQKLRSKKIKKIL